MAYGRINNCKIKDLNNIGMYFNECKNKIKINIQNGFSITQILRWKKKTLEQII